MPWPEHEDFPTVARTQTLYIFIMKNYSKYLSEFVGTYALVFCGAGAIVIDAVSGGSVGSLGISLTFGGIVLAMIYSFGEISGAHINPAVTLAFWAAGRTSARTVLPYMVSQFAGAIAASATLFALFPESPTTGGTLPAGSEMQSFVLEVLLTFFLMLVILQVSTGSKEQGLLAGIAIATVVMLEAAFAGPICGASMNPARSLGPALFSGSMESIWVYLAAPTLGALLSVPVWRVIRMGK